MKLGEMLVSAGIVTQQQIEEALVLQNKLDKN